MDRLAISYVPRPDATPDVERSALSAVYKFILDCHAKKKAAEHIPEPDGRDGTKSKEDSANAILPH